jgi:hypothetical protein
MKSAKACFVAWLLDEEPFYLADAQTIYPGTEIYLV